jgi:hypothetical protein
LVDKEERASGFGLQDARFRIKNRRAAVEIKRGKRSGESL